MNVDTTFGPLDVLCAVSGARSFHEHLPHTRVLSDFDMARRLLDRPLRIQVKSEANRPKDPVARPI